MHYKKKKQSKTKHLQLLSLPDFALQSMCLSGRLQHSSSVLQVNLSFNFLRMWILSVNLRCEFMPAEFFPDYVQGSLHV